MEGIYLRLGDRLALDVSPSGIHGQRTEEAVFLNDHRHQNHDAETGNRTNIEDPRPRSHSNTSVASARDEEAKQRYDPRTCIAVNNSLEVI
jgi:hypothetical protein